jgi:hypothetical protein
MKDGEKKNGKNKNWYSRRRSRHKYHAVPRNHAITVLTSTTLHNSKKKREHLVGARETIQFHTMYQGSYEPRNLVLATNAPYELFQQSKTPAFLSRLEILNRDHPLSPQADRHFQR